MIAFIIIGIIQGAVIGLIAIGLVLVYKGSRVFNFAQAEFGTVAAYVMWGLHVNVGLPYLFALLGGLIAAALMGFLTERLVVRPLFNAPRVTLLVATAGISLLAIAMELQFAHAEIRSMDSLIGRVGADGTSTGLIAFSVAGTSVSVQQLLAVAVLGGLAVGLAYFFNKTDLGLAVLATSQESVATELVGISTKRMSSFVWTFAAVLGGIAGVLQAPTTIFTPAFMTSNYLLLGFTAAVLGGITSLSGAFIGGQLIGLTQSLGSYFDSNFLRPGIEIPGFPALLVFLLLLTVLLVRPKGLLGAEA